MKQTKLTKTNEGVKFWLKNDDSSPHYIRGEFSIKDQGYKAFKDGDKSKETIFPKGKESLDKVLITLARFFLKSKGYNDKNRKV